MVDGALCHRLPGDWWDTGDDGNRLALLLCQVCPARQGTKCDAGSPDPQPVGVIRAGVAYSDTGFAMPICVCGYPKNANGRQLCDRCDPPMSYWRPLIERWYADGRGTRWIAEQLGYGHKSVREAIQRWGLSRASNPAGRQPVRPADRKAA